MKREIYEKQVKAALEMYEKAGIILNEQEQQNIEVVDFVRFEKGEGLEKREDNFADEVASMMK